MHRDKYVIKRDKKKLVLQRQEINEIKAKADHSKLSLAHSHLEHDHPTSKNREDPITQTPRSISTEPILVNPSVIDFGKICVGSSNQTNVTIESNLKKTTTVIFDSDSSELRESTPSLLSLDPKQSDSLKVCFSSDAPGIFERCVTYMINSKPVGRIFVKANVVRPNIDFYYKNDLIGPNEPPINLVYPSMNKNKAEAFLTLKNTTNAETTFHFTEGIDKSFSITPKMGKIPPYSEFEARITFLPDYNSDFMKKFKCQVSFKNFETEPKFLNVVAPNPVPIVKLVEPRLVWGLIPFGIESKRIIALTNESSCPATFQFNNINSILPSTFNIEKPSGVIKANSTLLIATTFTPNEIKNFDYRIHISVGRTQRNSRVKQKYELRMVGAVQKPGIQFSQQSFNFGAAPSGSIVPMSFTVQNKSSNSLAVVVFETDNECNFEKARAFTLSKNRLELGGEESFNMTLFFKPNNVASYNFYLNYTVNGLPGKIKITAVSARPEVVLPTFIEIGNNFDILPANSEPIKSVAIKPAEAGSCLQDKDGRFTFIHDPTSKLTDGEFFIKINNKFKYKIIIRTSEDHFDLEESSPQVIILPKNFTKHIVKLNLPPLNWELSGRCSSTNSKISNKSRTHVYDTRKLSINHDFMDFEIAENKEVTISLKDPEAFEASKGFYETISVSYNLTKIKTLIIIYNNTTNNFSRTLTGLAEDRAHYNQYLEALKSWIVNFISLDDSISKARRLMDKKIDRKQMISDSGVDFLLNRLVQDDNHEEARFRPINIKQLDQAYENLLIWLSNDQNASVSHIPPQALLRHENELIREDLSLGNFAEEKSATQINIKPDSYEYLSPYLKRFQFEFLLEFYRVFIFEKVDTDLERFYMTLLAVDEEMYFDIFGEEALLSEQNDKFSVLLFAVDRIWRLLVWVGQKKHH